MMFAARLRQHVEQQLVRCRGMIVEQLDPEMVRSGHLADRRENGFAQRDRRVGRHHGAQQAPSAVVGTQLLLAPAAFGGQERDDAVHLGEAVEALLVVDPVKRHDTILIARPASIDRPEARDAGASASTTDEARQSSPLSQ